MYPRVRNNVLAEHYLGILSVHVASVVLSGAIFMLRGLLIQIGRKSFAMTAPVRYTSYLVDSVLLVSALLLVVILPWAMFANGWLTVKLILVVVYVVLGTLALKRGRTVNMRRLCYVIALLTFMFIIGIAISHQPLGWLYMWMS